MNCKVSEIEWDTDEADIDDCPDLPENIIMPVPTHIRKEIERNLDNIVNYLTNKYGFLIKNCVIEIMST